jgi:eukaryotic-like serine/threonine-protein kinase
MSLSAGDKLGPYEIVAPIGAGGMGEVYKARDTRLDRIVAVKISHEIFSERFEREARVVAALNHSNICTLHDVGPNYLVMEYIEGTTLKGPLPFDQALKYAAQICDALDAAHKKGITHRDLKPANILVTKAGVKLLDFGLAKIGPAIQAGEGTMTLALTGKGEILGTFQYMSPEQVTGQDAGPQSDIFSFGLVLYEMLTGKRACEGSSPASVIAAIMERPAPSISDGAPPALDRVLQKCLAKDPDNRWQSARDLKDELEWIATAPELGSAVPSANKKSRLVWFFGSVGSAIALALAGLAFIHYREAALPELAGVRFQIAPPEKSTIDYFKLSPDGRSLAFVTGDRLWIRPLNSLEARSLAGTEGATQLFWSPDNQFLAFFAQGKLKKIAASGGPPQDLCNVTQSLGGTWNRNGVIVLPLSLGSGLYRVSASGGTPVPLSGSGGASKPVYPEFLPDGQHFLFSDIGTGRAIGIASLDGAPLVLVPEAADSPAYVPAADKQGGYLLFRRNDVLMAQHFNPTALTLSGDAVPVAQRIGGDPIWGAFSASGNGTLAYAPPAGAGAVQLAWKDRAGKQVGLFGPPGVYDHFRLSPDQKQITFTSFQNGQPDVWVMDSARRVPSKLTFDPAIDDPPMWSHDGQRIVWASNRAGGSFDLYIKPASGGTDQLLLKMGAPSGWAEDWSQNGRYILYQIPGAKTGQDLWIAPQAVGGSPADKPFPYLQTQFDEEHGRFSPDGLWVAYSSNESGSQEVYVQPFPAAGAKFQVSFGGGREPHWRKDGTELFYIGEGRTLTAVSVKLGSKSFQAEQAKRLFQLSILSTFIVGRSYEVSNDGQRFLTLIIPDGGSAPPLTVDLNWQAMLKK